MPEKNQGSPPLTSLPEYAGSSSAEASCPRPCFNMQSFRSNGTNAVSDLRHTESYSIIESSKEEITRIRSLRAEIRSQKECGTLSDSISNANPDRLSELSLRSEDRMQKGIKIEPFNMKSDMRHGKFDSDGYFTFHQRKRARNIEFEGPQDFYSGSDGDDDEDDDEDNTFGDPWLESLQDPRSADDTAQPSAAAAEEAEKAEQERKELSKRIKRPPPRPATELTTEEQLQSLDNRTLFMRLTDLLEPPNESPSGALRRLKKAAAPVKGPSDGNSTSRKPSRLFVEQKARQGGAQSGSQADSATSQCSETEVKARRRPGLPAATKMNLTDQKTFEAITDLCNFLMIHRSQHDILTMPRDKILAMSARQGGSSASPKLSKLHRASLPPEGYNSVEDAFWQFRWKRAAGGAEVHGPASTAQIREWIQAGYICDATPVDLRETTRSGDPIDGIWKHWKSVNLLTAQSAAAASRAKEATADATRDSLGFSSDEETGATGPSSGSVYKDLSEQKGSGSEDDEDDYGT